LEAPRRAAVAVAAATQPQLLPQPAAGHGEVQRTIGVHGELQGTRLKRRSRRVPGAFLSHQQRVFSQECCDI
jgi:hypothetical protein